MTVAHTSTSHSRAMPGRRMRRHCSIILSPGEQLLATDIEVGGRAPSKCRGLDCAISDDRPPTRFLDVFSLSNAETLGRGASSEVRKCIHRQSGQAFAVKIMKIATKDAVSTIKGRISREQVANEMEVCASLEGCPGVVQLHQFFEDIDPTTGTGFVFAVFDLMQGGTLAQATGERGSLPEDDARSVMKSLLATCISLHKRGIVHRDIKLENILLQHESVFDKGVKLADMGLSKRQSNLGDDGLLHDVCGTPMFMAPEMVQFDEASKSASYLTSMGYGAEVDIWSCGVCLFMLLCGFPPFEGRNLRELFDDIGAAKTNFSDPAWEMLTSEARDLVRRCLTRDPRHRITPEQALKHEWMTNM